MPHVLLVLVDFALSLLQIGREEFNPIAIVIRELPPLAALRAWLRRAAFDVVAMLVPTVEPEQVIRFWQPFRDFKHGKDAALRWGESELFGALDPSAPEREP